MELLVISSACRESVNRAVYRRLSTFFNINIHLVIPLRRVADIAYRKCSPVTGEPFTATVLEMDGPHPRLEKVRGLKALIRNKKPSHILVDAEAATLLVRDVGQAARHFDSQIWILSTENRIRDFMREGFKGLLSGRPALAIGGLIAWWLLHLSQHSIDHVFTICEDGTRAMSQSGFAGRITQMPLGFDPDLFYPQSDERIAATRQRLGLNSTTIAYFGRPLPEKGVDILLQALARMGDLRWQFLLDRFSLHKSAYQSQIQRQIETLGLADRVVHFDATHSEIPDYMNAADIVVLPSVTTPKFKEQYGRVIPEAMACGKIVVGSSSGAVPELIGDNGFVFPEGNVQRLADLLRCLLKAPADELNVMRTKATQRALTELSIVRQAEILYRMLKV